MVTTRLRDRVKLVYRWIAAFLRAIGTVIQSTMSQLSDMNTYFAVHVFEQHSVINPQARQLIMGGVEDKFVPAPIEEVPGERWWTA
jgi:hypothetical protein